MRMDIVRIVNSLSTQCSIRKFDFDLHYCYDLIFSHCKETKTRPSKHDYDIDEGVLVIDGRHIDRVAAFA